MKSSSLVLVSTLLVSGAVGCVSAEDDVLVRRDAGGDTGTDADTGPTDTGAPDTAPSCEGKTGATCKPGETRNSPCGNCGTVVDTCDTSTCTWNPGTCKGEGPCVAGDSETTACGTAGEVKKRTCSDKCAWSDYSVCGKPSGWAPIAAPPVGFDARSGHGAAWTGKEMVIVFGKGDSYKGDAAAYDPAKDTWRKLPNPPISARVGHATVAAGSKVFVFGGQDDKTYYGDGAVYDSTTDTWTKITSTGAPGARVGMAVGWTGTEVLVHAGYNGLALSDGAIYDPSTDKWRTWKAWPNGNRVGHRLVWNGTQAIVWGGSDNGGVICVTDGAVWNSATDSWTALATPPIDGRFGFVAWPFGSEMLVWGGYGGVDISSLYKSNGARWSPTTGWKLMSTPTDSILTPNGRQDALNWFGDGKLYVFSGKAVSAPGAVSGGAVYDAATDKWSVLPAKDAPGPRVDSTAVWTGKEAILWGGIMIPGVTSGLYSNGAIYRP